jgi:hypothetical protein
MCLIEKKSISFDSDSTMVKSDQKKNQIDEVTDRHLTPSNRKEELLPPPLPGTVRAIFTAYGSRISQPVGRAAERKK